MPATMKRWSVPTCATRSLSGQSGHPSTGWVEVAAGAHRGLEQFRVAMEGGQVLVPSGHVVLLGFEGGEYRIMQHAVGGQR